ncbi:MAG: quinone-dependent dihydroorotate dehydrogenase [Sphingomonadaceae bacterium]
MSLFSTIRPLLFRLDPEIAHRFTVNALKLKPSRPMRAVDKTMAVEVAGLSFPNPIGLAAGFDKDAEVPSALLDLGFGFVEIGTITPLAQSGNAKPRLFRLVEDNAVINRMGFNNDGHAAAHARLQRLGPVQGPIGVNIGANKDSADRIGDYVAGVRRMADVASYLTINISSPNTPGLRGLQDKDQLIALLDAVRAARGQSGPPLFLKLAPDLEPHAIDDIAEVVVSRVDGLIISNTTISRPPLQSRYAREAGGLSGTPLAALAHQRLRDFRAATGGAIPLIAVGGIASAEDAYARIRSGASLVQLYSALVFHGPGLARTITRGLKLLLERDGFASIAEAIGADSR